MPEKALKNVFLPGLGDNNNFILTGFKTGREKFFLKGKDSIFGFQYNEIPLFFEQSEKWEFLKDIFNG